MSSVDSDYKRAHTHTHTHIDLWGIPLFLSCSVPHIRAILYPTTLTKYNYCVDFLYKNTRARAHTHTHTHTDTHTYTRWFWGNWRCASVTRDMNYTPLSWTMVCIHMSPETM